MAGEWHRGGGGGEGIVDIWSRIQHVQERIQHL